MKNRYIETTALFGVLVFVSFLFTGCDEGDQSLGKNLIPGSFSVYSRNHTDSTSIHSYTFTDEKIRVDHPGYNYIGSFNDPLFGRTDGSFAAQFRLSSNPDYDPTSTLDSLVLRLTYKRIYGDTATVQTFKVYELNGDMDYEAKYFSTYNLKSLVSPVPIGSARLIPKFKTDSTGADTTAQYIRFKLDPALGNRLLKLDSLKMISNEEFLKYFKGLYIESTPVARKGTLLGLTVAGSGIGLYYHTATKDSLFFSYNVSSNSASVAAFSHDYSRSVFYPHLNQEVIEDTLIFVQPTGGTKAKINIPALSKWKDSVQYVISKASIVFYVDTLVTDYRRYQIPYNLYLKFMDSTGTETFPKDSNLSSSYYGGYFDPSTASYAFNITRHLEQIIRKEVESTSFFLVHADRHGSPNRVVLKGAKSSKPIKLIIKYSRYQ